MVQPRKEQIKNLKTKFTKFVSSGNLSLGGGPVQNIVNTGIESFYDNLLNSTVTKVVGGAETSSPGILYGNAGPFNLAAGNSFSITIPGVNAGSPVTVTLLVGDIVTLNSASVITVSRLVSRINTVFTGLGVLTPIAFNIDGRIVLKSATASGPFYGNSASITIQDITPGVVNTLGFSTTTIAVGTGTTAPKRGIITVSQDGLGGLVQLRNYNNSNVRPINPPSATTSFGGFLSQIGPGSPVFARLRAFPGVPINGRRFEFSYYRNGPIEPKVQSGVSAQSNFTSVISTDNIDITMDYGDGNTNTFNVLFDKITPVVTAQDIVDQINFWYRISQANIFGLFIGPCIRVGKAPFTFTSQSTRDSFFISANGLSPIHINPPSTVVSDQDLADYINTQVTLAGQTDKILPLYNNGEVFIIAQNDFTDTDVNMGFTPDSSYTASIEVFPGNPGGSVPGTYTDTLDYLGISAGQYKAAICARLVGGDEIEIFNPSSLPGASLQITGLAPIMAKLGLPASVNVSPTFGYQSITSPVVQSLLPEMMEFSEEVDSYDSGILDFKNEQDSNPVSPFEGVENVNFPTFLGKDGKIDSRFINKIFEYLSVNSLKLGREKAGLSTLNYKIPSIELPIDGNGNHFTLIWKTVSDNFGMDQRYYIDNNGFLTITFNAEWTGTQWARDVDFVSSIFETNNGSLSFGSFYGTATWTDPTWRRSIKFNPSTFSSSIGFSSSFVPAEVLRLGENTLTGPQVDIPRLSCVVNPSSRVLVQKISSASPLGISAASTSGDVYIYTSLSTAGSSLLEIVVNASYNSATALWTKNLTGNAATIYVIGQTEFTVKTRDAVVAGTWNDASWTRTQQTSSFITPFQSAFAGGVNLGSGVQNATSSRLSMSRFNPSVEQRTLFFESPIGGSGATLPLRIYINHSNAFLGQGYVVTRNCLWNSVSGLWNQDVPANRSVAWHFGNLNDDNSSLFNITSKPAGSAAWADTAVGWATSKTVAIPLTTGVWGVSTGFIQTWFFRPDFDAWLCNNITDRTLGRANIFFDIPVPTGATLSQVVIRCSNAGTASTMSSQITGYNNSDGTVAFPSLGSANSAGAGLTTITINTSFVADRELYNYRLRITPSDAIGDRILNIKYTFTDPGPRNY